MDTQLKIRSIVFNSVIGIKYLKELLIKYYIMSSNNSNSWMKLFSTAFISGACASEDTTCRRIRLARPSTINIYWSNNRRSLCKNRAPMV